MTIGDFRREREEALRRRLKDTVSRSDTEYCTADAHSDPRKTVERDPARWRLSGRAT